MKLSIVALLIIGSVVVKESSALTDKAMASPPIVIGCFNDRPCVRQVTSNTATACNLNGVTRSSVEYPRNALQNPKLTHAICANYCKDNNFAFAGASGAECFCGHFFGELNMVLTKECKNNCPGAPGNQKCGGEAKNTILYAEQVSCPFDPINPDSISLGCFKINNGEQGSYHNNTDMKGLKNAANYYWTPANMTQQLCINYCRNLNFTFAGIRGGQSCACGQGFDNFGLSHDCFSHCAGNNDQMCGGDKEHSVFYAKEYTCPPVKGSKCTEVINSAGLASSLDAGLADLVLVRDQRNSFAFNVSTQINATRDAIANAESQLTPILSALVSYVNAGGIAPYQTWPEFAEAAVAYQTSQSAVDSAIVAAVAQAAQTLASSRPIFDGIESAKNFTRTCYANYN